MTQPTVPIERKLQLVMREEVTYGVDVLGGSYLQGDILPAMDIAPTLDLEEIQVLATAGNLGRQLSAIGMERGGVSFRMNPRGKGAAYAAGVKPEWHNPVQGCGLIGVVDATPGAEKWTYTPNDDPLSQTIYIVQKIGAGAIAIKLVGCLGDVEFSMRAGAIVDARFTFQGLIAGVADIAHVAGAIVATPQYPVAKNAQFQIGTENYAPRIANIGIRLGNQLQPVPSLNSTGGLAGYFVADRNPRVTIDPEADLVANYPWYTKWTAATLADCTFQAGGTQYNRLKFSFPRLQTIRHGFGKRDGMTSLPTELLATIAAGSDDFTIVAD